ncbi:hypothetical protein GGR58DRAFT_525994 [Xylaria digitata]|nr:hypothetical protein GGR58DRAFT_525994 [Xylaria digitata]
MVGYKLSNLIEAFSLLVERDTNIGTSIAISITTFSVIWIVYTSRILFLSQSASSRSGKQPPDLGARTPAIARRKKYTQTKIIIASVVVGFLLSLGSVPFSYFITALLEATYGDSLDRNNACNENGPKISTTNAANSVYRFCVSIKHELYKQDKANLDRLDATGGFEGRAKIFVSEQATTWSDICLRDYGIDLKG